MHALRSSFAPKRFRLFFTGLCACAFLASPSRGDDSDDSATTNSALMAAQHWLDEIDNGQYDRSYAEGCLAFHNKVTPDQWKTVLKAIRPVSGTLLSRKVTAHSYKPDGFEGLQGECMVITYDSSFSKIPSEIEVVVLKREEGKWRGAGYNAQPQTDPQNQVDPDSTTGQQTTTTETQQSSGH